jgi:hypothetical protein
MEDKIFLGLEGLRPVQRVGEERREMEIEREVGGKFFYFFSFSFERREGCRWLCG